MPSVSSYSTATPATGDKLLGTDVSASNATANFTVGDLATFAETANASTSRPPSAHTQAATTISDSTATGRAVLTAADAAAARDAIGAGTAVARGRLKSATVNYYKVPGYPVISTGTRVMVNGRLYYEPWMVESAISIDQLAIEVTTAAASTEVRLALYNADADHQPTSLIVDAGTIDCSTTGVKTLTVSQTLQPGRYLAAINANGTPTLRFNRTPSDGVVETMGSSPIVDAVYVASAYAAFASTGVAWTTVLGGTAGYSHFILARVSAT